MHRAWMATAAVGALLSGAPASAADHDDVPESDGYVNTFSIGAGALGFVGRRLDVHAPSAVAWSVRYGWFVERNVQWEFAYVGASDALAPGRSTLVTIVESDLKVDVLPRAQLHPFVGAGLGYAAFSRAEADPWTVATPVFGGLEYDMGNLVISARMTGRPTWFDENAFTAIGADSWSFGVDLVSRY